jgi:hypothetical protein
MKHWESTLQFDRAVLGAFLGGKLGLQPSIDFKGKTGFGSSIVWPGIRYPLSLRTVCASGYGESGPAYKYVPKPVEGLATLEPVNNQQFLQCRIPALC